MSNEKGYSILFFDLETAVDHSKPFTFDESEVAIGNLKDPEKIAAKMQASRDAARGRRALCASTAQVVGTATVSAAVRDGAIFEPLRVVLTRKESTEAELLNGLCRMLSSHDIIVGFNSTRFDFPMLFGRCAALGVPFPLSPFGVGAPSFTGFHRFAGHVDLLPVVEAVYPQMQSHRLDAVTEALGIEHKHIDPPLNKAESASLLLMPGYAESGLLFDRIREQAEFDILALARLWSKLFLHCS